MLLLDTPVRVGGGVGFRDHLDPRTHFGIPRAPVVRAAALDGGAVSLVIDGAPPPEGSALEPNYERASVSLVRLEARRRAGRGPPSPPLAVARPLWTAPVPTRAPGQVFVRAELAPPDREEVERALEGRPTRLVVVSRFVVRGLESPVEARVRLDARAAHALLRRELPGAALRFVTDLGPWIEALVDEGALEFEGACDEVAERRLLEGVVARRLFEPEVSPAVLEAEVLEADPLLAETLEAGPRSSVGLRLRSPSELPETPEVIDASRGLIANQTLLARCLLLGPLPPPPVRSAGLSAAGDWTGVRALEIEVEGAENEPAERFELTLERPALTRPPPTRRGFRARAVLADDPAASILTRPGWTAWGPSPSVPLDPQQVAGRRNLTCGFGWVDAALVAGAAVRLEGEDDRVELRLDGARPEWAGLVIGTPTRLVAEIESGDGAVFSVKQPLEPTAAVVLPQPEALPAPILIRLCDPLGRFAHVQVDLEGAVGFGRRSFRLSAVAPDAVWTPPEGPEDYRYRVEARLEDGRCERTPLRVGPPGTLLVGDVDIELRPIDVHAGAEAVWLVFEAEDPPPGANTAVELYLQPGEQKQIDLPFRIGAELEYRVFGERYDERGEGTAIPAELARGQRWRVLD